MAASPGIQVRPARVIYHDISQRPLKINGRAIAAPKETPSLAPRALEETKAGAETEAIDAELEGGAAATEEMLEERLQAQGAGAAFLPSGGNGRRARGGEKGQG